MKTTTTRCLGLLITSLISLALSPVLCAAAIQKGEPAAAKVVNLVVIDTSGSMKAGRLATAVQEISQLGQQMPPSADCVWLLIPFHEKAYSTRIFNTGTNQLSAYLKELHAGGGTSIASGLKEALDAVEQYASARQLLVSLYTDGEDSNPAAVAEQETRLGQLFARRSEQGFAA